MTDLILEHISKRYGDHVVLEDFSARFPPGNVPASWVPQGVEKTTLLRIILGLEQPDHGTIQGQVRPVSAVFRRTASSRTFSALSNAAVVCPKGDRQEAARHLTALGLADSLSLPVRALSGGMKRRVSIARAVLAPGPLLVLDEPFTGLDRTTKAVVLDYLKRYTQGGPCFWSPMTRQSGMHWPTAPYRCVPDNMNEYSYRFHPLGNIFLLFRFPVSRFFSLEFCQNRQNPPCGT